MYTMAFKISEIQFKITQHMLFETVDISQREKQSTDANSDMMHLSELSDMYFKAAVIPMFCEVK